MQSQHKQHKQLNNGTAQSYKLAASGFFLPFFVIFVCFNLYPYAVSLFNSFYEWDNSQAFSLEHMTFVGFKNYKNLLSEPNIKAIFLHFLWFVPTCMFLIHSISLLLAKSIMASLFRFQGIFLMLLFIPYMISEESLARIFSRPFTDQDGWIVQFFNSFGIDETQTWLGQERRGGTPLWMAVFYLFFCTIVKYCGFFTLIYYMTLKSISVSVIESARLEGANNWQIFTKIEFPMIRKMFVMMTILSLIFVAQSSQIQAWLDRQIGLSRSEASPFETFSDLLQTLQLEYNDVGAAAALTWVFVAMILVFIVIGMLSTAFINKRQSRITHVI
ncbi:MAG: sugar ABC transporter permease [Saccharospirillaceae bacterium]|nr:sugar ABC transporter permease [Pseudomonadales bacterium]NRB81075.1 sugar ABC transporter permease [Saccharospirillaceae bacterium]